MTAAVGARMAAEIAEQPGMFAHVLDTGLDAVARVAAAIARRSPRFVLLAARGTSDHAALYAKYLVEIELGLPAGLASPSTMTVYGTRPDLRGVLFLTVSQSGASPDLVDSTATARAAGALTVAVTNSPGSVLAETAEYHVDIRAGVEQAVAATKSYTAQLLALYLLLTAVSGTADTAGLHRLPDAAAATLADNGRAENVAAAHAAMQRVVVTGRGYGYPTAREAALKLMETSYLPAHAFSGADLLHGPMAMVEPGVPVLVVCTPGAGADALAPVLGRLTAVGADVVPVGPADGLPVAAGGLTEALHPLVQILPLQQFALALARRRGSDPDTPRGLTKVTRTW